MEVVHMSKFIDFAELKERVSMEDTIAKLGLQLRKSANQLRGACPACNTGGDRALAITPQKQMFYCFAGQEGGDQIALISHLKGLSMPDAAQWLSGGTVQNKTTTPVTSPPAPQDGFAPLDYLQHDHPAVLTVGFDSETAAALGIGYANKGLMKGTVAVPVRDERGQLCGYIGITEAKLPPRWHLGNVVKLKTA